MSTVNGSIQQATSNNHHVPRTGDEYLVFGHLIRIVASHSESNGHYSIFEDNVPPAGGPPPHTHPDEEFFYVLEGEFEFFLNDLGKPVSMQAGDFISVPSMAVHTFRNVGTTRGKLLTMLLPGKLEAYFAEIGTKVLEATDVPDLSVTPDFGNMDLSKAFTMAVKHQVSFLLPDQQRR